MLSYKLNFDDGMELLKQAEARGNAGLGFPDASGSEVLCGEKISHAGVWAYLVDVEADGEDNLAIVYRPQSGMVYHGVTGGRMRRHDWG